MQIGLAKTKRRKMKKKKSKGKDSAPGRDALIDQPETRIGPVLSIIGFDYQLEIPQPTLN